MIDLTDSLSSGDAFDPYPLFLSCNRIKRSFYPTIPTNRNTRVPDDHRSIWWWIERTRKPTDPGDAVAMRSVIKGPRAEELNPLFHNAINFIFQNPAHLEISIFTYIYAAFLSHVAMQECMLSDFGRRSCYFM